MKNNLKDAIFASGCFWGTQYYMSKIPGVEETEVGYTGGSTKNPTYEDVSSGKTGHVEAVRIYYDPKKVSYKDLVKEFFETHNPTQVGGQGPDIGPQYKSKIFYGSPGEKAIAQKLISVLEKKGMDIATELEPKKEFYPAEEYHQNYYTKNGNTPYCHVKRKLF